MDLLKSPIQKLYRNFLVPSLLSAVVTSIYSFVDMIAIGRGVGPEGTAAISIATPILGIISFFGILCGVGGSVYLGKARGEGAIEKSNAYFSASLFLAVVVTIFVWMGFIVFSTPIYQFFGATENLMPYVQEYTNCIVWTMPFFILSAYLTNIVRSDGAPNKAMKAVIVGGVFNIFGDWFFVFPMGWGMFGAALATVLGMIIQFVILCSHFCSKKCGLRIVKPLRPLRAFRNILFTGFSSSIVSISLSILTVILNKQVVRYGGETALAVFGVVVTFLLLFQSLFAGVGQAIQPIVSTNFGAGFRQRIRQVDKLSLVTAFFMGAVFTLIGELFPLQTIRLFIDATPEILEITPKIFRIYFLSFLLMGVNIQSIYYFQSILKAKLATILALLRGLLFSGILVYLLPLAWGLDGVWWAMGIAEILVVAILVPLRRTNRQVS